MNAPRYRKPAKATEGMSATNTFAIAGLIPKSPADSSAKSKGFLSVEPAKDYPALRTPMVGIKVAMAKLGIQDSDLLEAAYIDLLEKAIELNDGRTAS